MVSFGNDVPSNLLASFALVDTAGLDNQLQTLDGQNVTFALSSGDLVGTVSGGVTEVIRIHIVSAVAGPGGQVTYTYSTTLSQPVEHADGALPENSELLTGVTFRATDSDGDPIQDTFDVTIVDDVPQAVADTTTTGEDTQITYNVITNGDGTSDLLGADAPVTLTAATLATAGAGVVGFAANGNITFTPTAGFEGAAVINYTITDQDGDTSSATLTVTVAEDSTPTVVSTTNLTVDEDGFGFAANDTLTARDDETPSTESLTQSGTAVVSFGNDVPSNLLASVALVDTAGLDNQLQTLDGQNVTFALSSGDLVGTVSGGVTEVIRIHIVSAVAGPGGQVTYTYSTTLSQPVEHADGALPENSELLTGVTFRATNSDGNSIQDTFDVTIVDDVPSISDIQDAILPNVNGTIVNGTWNPAFGADGLAISNAITLTLGSDPAGFDFQQTALGTSQEGTTVFKVDVFVTGATTPQYTFYYFSFYDEVGQDAVVKAYTQAPTLNPAGTFLVFSDNSAYFTLTMDSDGTYTFELIDNTISHTADSSDAHPGNYDPQMFIVGSQFFDAATLPMGATPDIIVDGSNDQNVFVNDNGIGVGNGNLENGETVSLQFTQVQTEVILTFGKMQANLSATFEVTATLDDGSITTKSFIVLGANPVLTLNASAFGLTDFETQTLTITKVAGAPGTPDDDQVNIDSITFNSRISDATYNFQVAITDGDGDVFVSPDELTVQLKGDSTIAPAGVAGEPINLGLTAPSAAAGALVTVAIADVPTGWTLNGGTLLDDGTWTVQTTDPRSLAITSPAAFTGAMLLSVTATWAQADGSTAKITIADNVEVFAPGNPIFAWSGDDHLTGSSGKDLFVFAQPIGTTSSTASMPAKTRSISSAMPGLPAISMM